MIIAELDVRAERATSKGVTVEPKPTIKERLTVPAIVHREDGGRDTLRLEDVDAAGLGTDLPTYEPLMDVLIRYYRGELRPEERRIRVGDLRIDPVFLSERSLRLVSRAFDQYRRAHEETMSRILVLKRSDGSLWVYDDTPLVAAAQAIDPAMTMACDLFVDPADGKGVVTRAS